MKKVNMTRNLRIAMINSEFPPIGGGAGNATFHLAKEFALKGHAVTVITTRYSGESMNERVDGFSILRVPAIRKSVARSNPVEQFSFMLGVFIKGLSFLFKWKPDIVIAFFGVPSGPGAYIHKRITKKPYIISLRGGDVPGFRPDDFRFYHWISAPIIRLVWRYSDLVVANSSGLRSLALKFDPNSVIEVIPNGVDPKKYTLNRKNWNENILLFTGRLVHQKGIDILLNALAEIKNKEFKLIIVGDGPEKQNLEEQTRTLKIDKRIQFTGWVNRSKLNDYYNEASIFVFPSRQEGMPNSILEAMSCGLPVIATKIAGSEELITEGKGGYLTTSEDLNELIIALESLLEDKYAREEMGRFNRQLILKKYTWLDIASKYEELIKDVIGKV